MGDALGLKVEITESREEYEARQLPRINYSDHSEVGGLKVTPHSILSEYGVHDHNIEVFNHAEYHKIFFKVKDSVLPFDLFGAAFWLLSRYEEYLPHKTDKLNRFHYKTSLAYQHDFLHLPLVNLWLSKFTAILRQTYPELNFGTREFNYVSSIDVDNAYQFKYKGFVRALAGFISDVTKWNWPKFRQRASIILGKQQDPYDCYDFLIQENQKHNVNSVYFFLIGDYGVNDKNHSATNLQFQALIKHVNDYSKVGIHPSFGSNNNLHQLKVELNRLSNITHRTIGRSRQHFSVLKFPETYQSLILAGISEDYSMGYTNMNGFRASYCYPFKWYNIDEEFTTTLLLHPFVISENTIEYLSVKSKKSFQELTDPYIEQVKLYHGELVSIFHNSNFDADTRKNYSEFVSRCTEAQDKPSSITSSIV